MGLSNFPSAAEGVLPVLVMNTVMSVAILKNLLNSFIEFMGATNWVFGEENSTTTIISSSRNDQLSCNSYNIKRRVRGISIMKFKSSNFTLVDDDFQATKTTIECCVCLSKFEEDEEVSELSCQHFFHKKCLDKWFDNHHSTCPLCRSIH